MTTITLPNGRTFNVVGSGVPSRNDAPDPSPAKPAKRAKYGNRHCIIGSERFDSEREGRRHLVLLEMQKRGEIRDLKRQVTFKLTVDGQLIGKVRPDWTYEEDQGAALRPAYRWRKVAEDSKGFQTRDHKTRWKLAKALHPEVEWRLS
jgi:hypothetical protein